MRSLMLVLIMLVISILPLAAIDADPPTRGGIEYSFANVQIINLADDPYFCFDVMASGNGDRLGTGILLINYNSDVFGTDVHGNGNAIVTRGSLITTSPFPFYGITVNDNNDSRLAITFEYTLVAGWGGLLAPAPQQLMHIRLRILNHGSAVGLSFAQNLMTNQQFMDDNSTLFNPMIATDTEDTYLPLAPLDLNLTIASGMVQLSWQGQASLLYNIYFAQDPNVTDWQILASGIAESTWSHPITSVAGFYRITSE